MAHGPTDGRTADHSSSIPVDRLAEADSIHEICTVVDTVLSELSPVSDVKVWVFDTDEKQLVAAGNTVTDAAGSPSKLAADAFETGEQQQSFEPTDRRIILASPLGTVGVVALTTDDVTPTVRETVDRLSTVGGVCLEHRRQYAQLERRFHQIVDRNRQLSQFARTVSHDLNSPLSVIYGRIELSLAEPDEADVHLQAALNAAQRVESLVSDHLQTIETAGSAADTEVVSVQTVATEAWRIIDPPMARLRIEPQLDRVEANAIQLQQVFENLIRNAIEHGSEGTVGLDSAIDNPESTPSVFDDDANTVTVTIKPTSDGFAVCDDGVGIPEASREEIFNSGYTTTESGSGLGLHIVGEIVEAHGWEISVGESIDGGARFDIHVE